MCMGIPEGNGKNNYRVVPNYFLKLAVPIVVPIAIFYFFKTFKIFGVKFSFSSLTSKPRELDRFGPCFHAYWYFIKIYWNQTRFIFHYNFINVWFPIFSSNGETKVEPEPKEETAQSESSRHCPHWPPCYAHYRPKRVSPQSHPACCPRLAVWIEEADRNGSETLPLLSANSCGR